MLHGTEKTTKIKYGFRQDSHDSLVSVMRLGYRMENVQIVTRFWAWETDFVYFKESRLAAAPTRLLLNG